MRRPLGPPALIVLGLLASFLCWRAYASWQFQSSLVQAKELQEQGKIEAARTLLISLERANPANQQVVYQIGKCEYALKHPQAAIDAWSRLENDGEFAKMACDERAELLITAFGRFAEAERLLEARIRDRSKSSLYARELLAKLYRHEGRLDEVRTLLQDDWRQGRDRAVMLRELWLLDHEPVPIAEVRSSLDEAAAKSPQDDRVWLGRANLESREGNLAAAETLIERCRAAKSGDHAVASAALRWGLAAHRSDVVLAAAKDMKASALDSRERLGLVAWLTAETGNRSAEEQALGRLIDQYPFDPFPLDRLAALASARGDNTRAIALRRKKSEGDTARERYRQLLANPPQPQAYAELARLAETLGRDFEARGWWSMVFDAGASDAIARLDARLKPDETLAGQNTTLAETLADIGASSPNQNAPSKQSIAMTFRDDAKSAGLKFRFNNGRSASRLLPETMSGGIGLIDYDNDGWLDVYAVQGGTFPPAESPAPTMGDRLFRNLGNGKFEDVTERTGLARFPGGYGHGVSVGDVDNDGCADLFVTRWRSYALYRNKGDGTFEDATTRFGFVGDRDWPTSSAFADLDNDGDLDLYVCHYLSFDLKNPLICRLPDRTEPHYCDPRHFPALQDHIFRNDGGKFVDVTAESGLVDTNGRGLGVVAADVNDDGKIDLFVANDTTANYLLINRGGMKFEEMGVASGVACNAAGGFQAGMGTACADVDGDGRLDLLVTNFYGESTTFYRNLGGGSFGDESTAIGLKVPSRFMLGFGLVAFDADNDGHIDLATANGHVDDLTPSVSYEMPTQLLLNGPRGRLVDATRTAGEPWTIPRLGRGLARGDLDNDGREDLVLIDQTRPLVYFHNQTDLKERHWLTFQLQGTKSPRDAVGAVVTVESGGRKQVAVRAGGGSYLSACDGRVHLGLGNASKIDSVEVHWPSGRVERFAGLAVDRIHRLVEGAGTAR